MAEPRIVLPHPADSPAVWAEILHCVLAALTAPSVPVEGSS